MAVILGKSGITFSDSTSQYTLPTDTGSAIQVNSYTTAGTYTWTKPTGCTSVLVKVVGGGGGGAGYCESGAAGGYTEMLIDVTSVSTVTVTVGGAGNGVAYYAAASTGGTSSFGSYCSATGGGGANSYSSHSGGFGGIGSGGDVNLRGSAGSGHTNSVGYWPGGRGGYSYWGGGGGWNRATATKLYSGAPGAGGSGGRSDEGGTGGVGEPGAVIVYCYK